MSRAHAVASLADAKLPFGEPGRSYTNIASVPAVDHQPPNTSVYLDRAMLLWPRLDRNKLSRYAHDPDHIAQIVQQRTSQPHDAILAMLTKGSPKPAGRSLRVVDTK
jgi:hypothetical protein